MSHQCFFFSLFFLHKDNIRQTTEINRHPLQMGMDLIGFLKVHMVGLNQLNTSPLLLHFQLRISMYISGRQDTSKYFHSCALAFSLINNKYDFSPPILLASTSKQFALLPCLLCFIILTVFPFRFMLPFVKTCNVEGAL